MAPVTAWQVENMFSQSFRVQSSCLVIWSYSFEFSIKLGHNPIFEWARKTRSKTETARKIQMQVQNLGSYRGGIVVYMGSDMAHRRRNDMENAVTSPIESLIIEVIIR